MIQAPKLVHILLRGYYFEKYSWPPENPRWRPFFSRWPPIPLQIYELLQNLTNLTNFNNLSGKFQVLEYKQSNENIFESFLCIFSPFFKMAATSDGTFGIATESHHMNRFQKFWCQTIGILVQGIQINHSIFLLIHISTFLKDGHLFKFVWKKWPPLPLQTYELLQNSPTQPILIMFVINFRVLSIINPMKTFFNLFYSFLYHFSRWPPLLMRNLELPQNLTT